MTLTRFPCLFLQPADSAPDEEHPDFNQITGLRRSRDGRWECQYRMQSVSGDYEDIVDWAPVATVFDDLEADDNSNGPEENLLVLYLQKHGTKTHKPVAQLLANKRNVDLVELFPSLGAEKEKESTKAASDSDAGLEELPKECDRCCHDDYLSYATVDCKYFFEEERKYSEARCNLCEKWFSTSQNGAKQRQLDIPLPTAATEAFACNAFDKNYCACGIIVCKPCFLEKQGATGRSTRRRR